jgi:hypothetical protein
MPGAAQHLLSQPCEDCGGPVVRERRRPGAEHAMPLLERRDGDREPDTVGSR